MPVNSQKWIMYCSALAGILAISLVILGSHCLDTPSSTMDAVPNGNSLPKLQGGVDQFVIESAFPSTPASIPLYSVKSVENIQEGNEKKSMSIKNSIPTSSEAPSLAKTALEKYGGLPTDARLDDVIPLYISKYNLTTQTVEEKYPQRTQLLYTQQIEGMPVYRTRINIMLGENGELLDIYKHWISSYEYAGKTSVISAEEGFEELKKGKTTAKLQGSIPEGTRITDIELGYYLDEQNSDILKPVWVYKAVMVPGTEPFNLYVNAAQ